VVAEANGETGCMRV
jgi:hypothetical protein